MSAPAEGTCPRCGARTPQRAQWCSLCHLDFRPASRAATLNPPVAPPAPPRGRHRRDEVAPVASLDGDTVDAMVALLAAEHATAEKAAPVLGRFQDRGTRVGVMVVGAVVVAVLTFLVLVVLGSLAA